MHILNSAVPAVSSLLSFLFAAVVLSRFARRRGLHLLLWGLALVMYAIGGLCEAWFGLAGWNPVIFRLWYLFGAVLVAAWLGQGTVYLLVNRRVAHALMVVVAAASVYAAWRVSTASLDPGQLTSSALAGTELSGSAITSGGVRILTPFFNLYGTIALVGGAAWSAFVFWRRRILLHRTVGNIVIAVGALIPAFGGTFSRLGVPGALYLGELLGVVLMFLGFLRATTPMKGERAA